MQVEALDLDDDSIKVSSTDQSTEDSGQPAITCQVGDPSTFQVGDPSTLEAPAKSTSGQVIFVLEGMEHAALR